MCFAGGKSLLILWQSGVYMGTYIRNDKIPISHTAITLGRKDTSEIDGCVRDTIIAGLESCTPKIALIKGLCHL